MLWQQIMSHSSKLCWGEGLQSPAGCLVIQIQNKNSKTVQSKSSRSTCTETVSIIYFFSKNPLNSLISTLWFSLASRGAAAHTATEVSSVSVQSDWGRFLYDGFSLCEHPLTVGIVETLTVVNCCIFSLNSTDGQSEGRVWSTACKTTWNPWCSTVSIVN